MVMTILLALLALSAIVPFGVYLLGGRKADRFKTVLAVNIITFFGILLFTTAFLFTGYANAAETAAAATAAAASAGDISKAAAYFSAALVTAVATVATGAAVGKAASAAIGALSENDKIMGKVIIFVAMAEGIAIYGLLVSLFILGRV